MNRFLLIFLMVLILASSAFASTTNCASGSLTLYLVNNYSCMSGNLTFSNFHYNASANPAGLAIPASGISVTPLTANSNEGFQFAGGWLVGTQSMGVSSFQDSLITFDVSGPLTGLNLTFNGSNTSTGLAGVAETYCLNHSGIGCPNGFTSGQINVTNPPPKFNDATSFFGTVTSISISKDIRVDSGINGTASISQVINTFTNSPEPMSIVLVGSGLLGLGVLRKRLRKSS